MNEINELIYSNEEKKVWLRSRTPKSSSELWKLLRKLGFTRHYDIFSLDRKADKDLEIWQSETIVRVSVFYGNRAVYFKDEKFYDAIQLSYLLLNLPMNYISVFTKTVEKVSEELNLPVEYNGDIISEIELKEDLMKSADEFAEKVAEPGSETAAMLISSAYPRKSFRKLFLE